MKTTSKPTSELLGKLTRYTALAGAAGLGGNLAQAGITVWNSGESITAPSGGIENLYFDFETGTVQTTLFAGADFQFNVQNFSRNSIEFNVISLFPIYTTSKLAQAGSVWLARRTYGDPVCTGIKSNSIWGVAKGSENGNLEGDWKDGGRGYAGFYIEIGATMHYGWADITIGNVSPQDGLPTLTLNRFAYNESPDECLNAGQTVVPEPESALPMALLVLGAAGLGRYRRQRAAQTGPDGEKTAA